MPGGNCADTMVKDPTLISPDSILCISFIFKVVAELAEAADVAVVMENYGCFKEKRCAVIILGVNLDITLIKLYSQRNSNFLKAFFLSFKLIPNKYSIFYKYHSTIILYKTDVTASPF